MNANGAMQDPFSDLSENDYLLINGPLPQIGKGEEFVQDDIVPAHSHEFDQLIYPGTGVLTVTTEQGAWVVPPERAVWIPAGVTHALKVMRPVSNRSLFFTKRLRVREAKRCEIIDVSPLMHNLIMEAFKEKDNIDSTRAKVLLLMILAEIRNAPNVQISLSFPKSPALLELCEEFVLKPEAPATIDGWSKQLGMSRRAFTRHFRSETGLSLTEWRQQACLFAALPRLAAGESVTNVSFDLGYSSPSAFTMMFKRILGVPPHRYFHAS